MSPGPLIALGALGLGLLALWGYGRSREHSCGQATVTFAPHAGTLTAGDASSLQDLAKCLKSNASASVRLEGRADPAEASANGALAQGRADAIGRELTMLGVPASQFSVGTSAICRTERAPEACRSASAIPLR